MKLRLLKSVVIAGNPGLKVGDVFEHQNAHALIGDGFAEEAKEEITTRVEVVENRDPVTAKKKNK